MPTTAWSRVLKQPVTIDSGGQAVQRGTVTHAAGASWRSRAAADAAAAAAAALSDGL